MFYIKRFEGVVMNWMQITYHLILKTFNVNEETSILIAWTICFIVIVYVIYIYVLNHND